MKKVLFLTNLPSPYRIDFFNELGKHCDLHVIFEKDKSKTRDDRWQSYNFKNFTAYFPKSIFVQGQVKFYKSVTREYKKISPDITIVCNYSSSKGYLFLLYLIARGARYSIEGDGALFRPDSCIKHFLKKLIFKRASKLLYTTEEHKKYLMAHGASEAQLFFYPFTSIFENEILLPGNFQKARKDARNVLFPKNQSRIQILSVGRFIPVKRFDLLLKAFKPFDSISNLLIIGGQPTKEYLDIIESLKIENVSFLPFMNKASLYQYMRASDVFVFTSEGDVWGLVINEAMANGMPVIATTGCLGAVQMSKNNPGLMISANRDLKSLQANLAKVLAMSECERNRLSICNLKKVREYTIENMAKRHIEIFSLDQ